MYLYNETVFLSFIGGICSLILTVVVLFIKQNQKRKTGRELFKERYRNNPEIGDIETKLNESTEYKKPIVSVLFVEWGLQPLYIIAFIGLTNHTSLLEIFFVFALTIIVLLHEFVWEQNFSDKPFYKFFVILLWVIFYFLLTVEANKKDTIKHELEISNRTLNKADSLETNK